MRCGLWVNLLLMVLLHGHLSGNIGLAAECQFPNNTGQSIHWWPCESDGDLVFSKFTINHVNGSEEYPLSVSKSMVLTAQVFNNGSSYAKITNTIDVWLFSGIFDCSWISIPTFGLLRNRDPCLTGLRCPIEPGDQQLRVPLDFGDYWPIIKLMKDDASYQIQFVINNIETNKSDCVFIQVRAKS